MMIDRAAFHHEQKLSLKFHRTLVTIHISVLLIRFRWLWNMFSDGTSLPSFLHKINKLCILSLMISFFFEILNIFLLPRNHENILCQSQLSAGAQNSKETLDFGNILVYIGCDWLGNRVTC